MQESESYVYDDVIDITRIRNGLILNCYMCALVITLNLGALKYTRLFFYKFKVPEDGDINKSIDNACKTERIDRKRCSINYKIILQNPNNNVTIKTT